MFSESEGPQQPEQPQRPPMPPRKVFKVKRYNSPTGRLEEFIIEAHFMAPLDGGRMAFNVYDFDTPQGVTTVRVINHCFDIEQITPSGIVH